MANLSVVEFSPEAPPVVRVFANTLRLSLQRSGLGAIKGMNTLFSIRSCKDPQALTIRIRDEQVYLTPGVHANADIVITMDFDAPDEKPSIKGLWRHPLLAMKIGKLLSLPLPNWADSAKRFWQATHQLPDMPTRLIVTCSNEARSLTLGEGEPRVEIIGNSDVLEQLLAGNTLLVQEVMTGKIRIRGSIQHMAGLCHAGQKIMLGEIAE